MEQLAEKFDGLDACQNIFGGLAQQSDQIHDKHVKIGNSNESPKTP